MLECCCSVVRWIGQVVPILGVVLTLLAHADLIVAVKNELVHLLLETLALHYGLLDFILLQILLSPSPIVRYLARCDQDVEDHDDEGVELDFYPEE